MEAAKTVLDRAELAAQRFVDQVEMGQDPAYDWATGEKQVGKVKTVLKDLQCKITADIRDLMLLPLADLKKTVHKTRLNSRLQDIIALHEPASDLDKLMLKMLDIHRRGNVS